MLDERTKQLILETFANQVCCQCGSPATRLSRRKFYCPNHAPGRRKEADPGANRRQLSSAILRRRGGQVGDD